MIGVKIKKLWLNSAREVVMGLITKVFGTHSAREIKKIRNKAADCRSDSR